MLLKCNTAQLTYQNNVFEGKVKIVKLISLTTDNIKEVLWKLSK